MDFFKFFVDTNSRWGGLSNKNQSEVSTKCVNEDSSIECRGYSRQVQQSFAAVMSKLSQCWLDKLGRPPLVKSTSLGVLTVQQYLLRCCVITDSEVSEEEGSYALNFYRWFLESL